MDMILVLRGPVDDADLSALHDRAFASPSDAVTPWSERLARHSLTWVTATDPTGNLVGFVNVIGDGGAHAVLLDTVVDPEHQGRGVGRALVVAAADAARDHGCEWLHVDFEEDRSRFYLDACGFRTTAAGIMRLA
ncbi:GNAT family N-acetyltransferase [Promicromonospora sp. MEB111]|uniref:GNAT family N-acetyltransferase n=1 Tax=Promicromonospora sp. MEB111 TaxID=3040301 RepID=UPI002549C2F1|nr:GNAT family N-acetyltransferase [Promicromonospora sp. MEB111]